MVGKRQRTSAPVPSAEVVLFMSWGTKKKMDLWNTAVVGHEIIIHLTSEIKVFIWVW